MEKINYFPSELLMRYNSGKNTRQDYFFELLRDEKQFQNFNNSYLNFCNIQEIETLTNESSNCLLFKGICSNLFSKKTKKIVKKSIYFSFLIYFFSVLFRIKIGKRCF